MPVDYDNYNSLALKESTGTAPVLRTGMMQRVASNGGVRSRGLQSAAKTDWTIAYRLLTQAEYNALKDFYDHGPARTFDYTALDGVTRDMQFAAAKPYDLPPTKTTKYTGNVFLVEA